MQTRRHTHIFSEFGRALGVGRGRKNKPGPKPGRFGADPEAEARGRCPGADNRLHSRGPPRNTGANDSKYRSPPWRRVRAPLRWACKKGPLAVARWLAACFDLTAHDARTFGNEALGGALDRGHLSLAVWLVGHFGLTAADAWSYNNTPLPLVRWQVARFGLKNADARENAAEVLCVPAFTGTGRSSVGWPASWAWSPERRTRAGSLKPELAAFKHLCQEVLNLHKHPVELVFRENLWRGG